MRAPRPIHAARRARAALPALAATGLIAALGGCGSSSDVGNGKGTTTTAGTSTTSGTTSPSGSSLKVIGRPRFPTPSKSEQVQSGVVQNYALVMGGGIVLIAVVYLFLKPQ